MKMRRTDFVGILYVAFCTLIYLGAKNEWELVELMIYLIFPAAGLFLLLNVPLIILSGIDLLKGPNLKNRIMAVVWLSLAILPWTTFHLGRTASYPC